MLLTLSAGSGSSWLSVNMVSSLPKITLTFNEFAKMCGISSTNINKRTRARFKESLMNLHQVVFPDSRSGRFTVTHLVQKAMIDPKSDTVELVGVSFRRGPYRYDHKTLLSLQVLYILAKRSCASSIFILKQCQLVRCSLI